MKNAFVIAAVAVVLFASSACGRASDGVATPSGASSVETAAVFKTLQVAPARVECTGVGPQLCLQVRESSSAPWKSFYGTIAGFDYEPGYLYEIRVKEETVANPPADASSLRVTLVSLLSKTPAPASLIGTTWRLVSLDNRPALPGVRVTAVFAAGDRLSGSGGCNSYAGSATVEGERLKVDLLATTLMACGADGVMDQEQAFLTALAKATVYRVVGRELQLGPAPGVVSAVFSE